MNRATLIVVLLSIGMVGLLYSLPKGVVSSKSKDVVSENQSEAVDSTAAVSQPVGAEQHGANPLTAVQVEEIESLKKKAGNDPVSAAEAFAAVSDAFFKYQKFDSSAVYAEKVAELQPTAVNYLRTGDRYYEAFSFAMGGEKSAELAVKTREYYQKALDLNPSFGMAKANMAMTYVNSENPMQGISMLREILDQDPTNEVALFNMGILSMQSNQYNRAVQRFNQIVVNNPDNMKAKFYLAVSLMESGKKEEARPLLKEVKEKEKDPVIQRAIAELEASL